MEMKFDIAVIGAGPAGSAAAIVAARRGFKTVLFEAGSYPRHKVCGEFVSAEAAEVLRFLLREKADRLLDSPRIQRSRLHHRGRTTEVEIDPPAYSIPRFVLDDSLWRAAGDDGVSCVRASVESVSTGEGITLTTSAGEFQVENAVNASGKWSRLNQETRGDAWLGLKAHFRGEADDAVDLYFFEGGYCGVQSLGNGLLNACALVKQGCARTLNEVFDRDPRLRARAANWKAMTETFATAPVYLGMGSPLKRGILQAGDAAGFVDPFVGDGISLALRSGTLAGATIGTSADEYSRLYHLAFGNIFKSAGNVRALLEYSGISKSLSVAAMRFSPVASWVFRKTRRSELDILKLATASHAPV